MMANPRNEAGRLFEHRCNSILRWYRLNPRKIRYYWGSTKAKDYYEFDAITARLLCEFKYQKGNNGSVKNKLCYALMQLSLYGAKLNLKPVLVYSSGLEYFVHNDPVMLHSRNLYKEVEVMSFEEFRQFIAKRANLIYRKEDRLLEYA